MPLKDGRARSIIDKGNKAGLRNCTYRDVDGNTWNAVVLGGGSASGLKLRITSDKNRVVDNVPKATGLKQTNVYFLRTSQP